MLTLIQGKRGKPPFVSPASLQRLEKSLITRQAGTWRRSLLSQQKTPVRKKMPSLNSRKDANATFFNACVETKLRKNFSPKASAVVEARTSVLRICKRHRTQERREGHLEEYNAFVLWEPLLSQNVLRGETRHSRAFQGRANLIKKVQCQRLWLAIGYQQSQSKQKVDGLAWAAGELKGDLTACLEKQPFCFRVFRFGM